MTAITIVSSDDSFSSFDDVYSDLDPDATVSPPKPRLMTEDTIGSTDSLLLEMEVQDLKDRVNSVEHTQLKILQVQESILACMKQVFGRLSDLERSYGTGNRSQWQSRTPSGADYYPTHLERSRGTGNRPQMQCSTPCGADYYPTPYYIPPPPNHPADQPYDNHPDSHTPVHPVAVKAVPSALPSESIDAGN